MCTSRLRSRVLAKTLIAVLIPTVLSSIALSQSKGARYTIVHDKEKKTLTLTDGKGNLTLGVNYKEKCIVDKLSLKKTTSLCGPAGIYSGIVFDGKEYSSQETVASPTVSTRGNSVTISDIVYRAPGIDVQERWIFKVHSDNIRWRIERTYRIGGVIEEALFPSWNFKSMSTWDAALLGNGGVAWFKLFDSLNATYGVHTNTATFWNKSNDACLRVVADGGRQNHVAMRFSRQPDNELTCSFSVSDAELIPKYDSGTNRRRYLPGRQDVWSPFRANAATVSVEYTLTGLEFDKEYYRGTFKHFDGEAVRTLLNTIARVGVVDTRLHGSNSWRTPYGPVCLHEQWIAQIGLALNDQQYLDAYKVTLDYFRDKAIEPDGRVKSRWAYTCEDAKPGTCDSLGFYETQWGHLLDSNPSYVTNVAELFDLTGDMKWVKTHKTACERALDYLMKRDSNGNGLVEMTTSSHSEGKSSDWIDVIWASYENAFVNAELYYALALWSDIEDLLGDRSRASTYRMFAQKLKASFNKTTDDGGFWEPHNQWYVYWRDKDNSIHGNNLTVPVNFMAVAYGLCDDTTRSRAILNQIEAQMQKENLFAWPLCLFSYAPGEGASWQWPFPNYENGDIFLSWGEVGTRAYASYDAGIGVKYIDSILARYKKDGLAFQRYLRKTQEGAGDDILAGNCFAIVGLYRNVYGIQPKYNRLYLEPHLTPELNGTRLNYRLRKQTYEIRLSTGSYRVQANAFIIETKNPFGVSSAGNTLEFFHENRRTYSLRLTRNIKDSIYIAIEDWGISGADHRKWTESSRNPKETVAHEVADLKPNTDYTIHRDGKVFNSVRSDGKGRIRFQCTSGDWTPHTYDVKH